MDSKLQSFIVEHENDDLRKLALQANNYPDIDIPFALRQIKGKQIAKTKLPLWYNNPNIIYPEHLALEQASSEATARYKASLFKGKSLLDLTGGLGVDFSFMSVNFKDGYYVESNPYLVELANHNFKALGLSNTTTFCCDAVEYLKHTDHIDTIYIDPARRSSSGQKTVRIEDCTPDIVEIEKILDDKADNIVIKLSPMLDITKALQSLNNVTDVYIISFKNECKELLFVKKKIREKETVLHCINIYDGHIDSFSFNKSDELSAEFEYTSSIAEYLYEPNASIMKAAAFKKLGSQFGLKKLHPNSHLYTSDNLIHDFPGRQFMVEDVFSLSKKELKDHLGRISKANLSIRNFPMSVDDLRKKLRLKDGGENYIFATILFDEKKILIKCSKIKKG